MNVDGIQARCTREVFGSVCAFGDVSPLYRVSPDGIAIRGGGDAALGTVSGAT